MQFRGVGRRANRSEWRTRRAFLLSIDPSWGANGYGEDLADPAVRAQCVAVFGLGGPLAEDDAAEAGLVASPRCPAR